MYLNEPSEVKGKERRERAHVNKKRWRDSSFFCRGARSISTLVVVHTENTDVMRATFVMNIGSDRSGLVEANLYNLVDVLLVENRNRTWRRIHKAHNGQGHELCESFT